MRQDPIRNCEEFLSSLRNFEDWLPDEVPGASDLDCVLHASNPGGDAFLVFEFKHPGRPVPRGQRIMLEGLKRAGFTVVVVWGPDADDEFVLGWDWEGKVSREALAQMVRMWWQANKKPGPRRAA